MFGEGVDISIAQMGDASQLARSRCFGTQLPHGRLREVRMAWDARVAYGTHIPGSSLRPTLPRDVGRRV